MLTFVRTLACGVIVAAAAASAVSVQAAPLGKVTTAASPEQSLVVRVGGYEYGRYHYHSRRVYRHVPPPVVYYSAPAVTYYPPPVVYYPPPVVYYPAPVVRYRNPYYDAPVGYRDVVVRYGHRRPAVPFYGW